MNNNNKLIKTYIKEYLTVKEQIESQTSVKSSVIVFLDMDGVLADFDKAMKSSNKVAEEKQKLVGVLKATPELAKLSEDELKARLKGPQTEPSLKALKKAFQQYSAVKYGLAGQEGFFMNLEEMPGAKELIQGVADITGNLPNILTAPVQGSHCEKEKKLWMFKHFNGMFDKFYCDPDKGSYAQGNPNNVLIDDRTKNTIPFERNGGTSIFYSGDVNDALSKVQDIVNKAQGTSI